MSKQFFKVQPIETALATLFFYLNLDRKTETIKTQAALGRVLANNPQSPMDLPAFNRSAMDGYAVKAADTFGASDSLPAYLKVTGHINMGEVPDVTLQSGEAAEIHTGAMLPDGADAVVMIERTQKLNDDEIEVLAPVAIGENVIQQGEDVRKDSAILAAGHRLRPQDIGGLLAVGIGEVEVIKQPQVAILSCGDELVEANETPTLAQIRDINSHMLIALCSEIGAECIQLGIARDTLDSMLSMARDGLAQSDMLILSAGSSVSTRDLTYEVVNQLGKPGVLQHGLAVKPGKPTILAACEAKPVIGLPGNPVSALLVARQVVIPILRFLMNENVKPLATISATLTQNIASTSGREDFVPVKIIENVLADDGSFVDEGSYRAEPIWGKSNLIYTLLKADGIVHVPLNISGYPAATRVNVTMFS